MATEFLQLDLPVVSTTLGPEWANQVNAAFEVIDSHNHTSGKGVQIPTAGLNIDANLDFNSFAVLNAQYTSLVNRSTSPSGSTFANSISVLNGDLYYTNASGVAVQVTSGGSIASIPGAAQTFETQQVAADLVISPASTFVYLLVDTTVSRTITLPLASSVTDGRIYIVKDISGQSNTNNITLAVSGSDTIDGQSSITLDSDFGSSIIVGDGNDKWYQS